MKTRVFRHGVDEVPFDAKQCPAPKPSFLVLQVQTRLRLSCRMQLEPEHEEMKSRRLKTGRRQDRGSSSMAQLKFWYEIHNYQSHRRVAEVYRQMLTRRYSSAESIDDADVVVLHLEPHNYESIYNRFSSLRTKYVVSYCVWEASELPEIYQRSLALVQEVWTCSNYCLAVIRKHHPRV